MDVYLIREALRAVGVERNVQVVNDGDAAIKFFDAVDLDENAPCPVLILLDMNLPKRSGSEVLNHVRKSVRCSATPVIIVSSSDAPRDHAALANLSVAAYFKKPMDFPEFMKLGPLVTELLA